MVCNYATETVKVTVLVYTPEYAGACVKTAATCVVVACSGLPAGTVKIVSPEDTAARELADCGLACNS